MAAISYAESGVNRQVADQLVEKIGVLSKSTLNRQVKSSVGGYASLFEIDKKNWIAASTDGVGTKLKLANRLNKHDTVGIDLVAMSVNDLLCVGAKPLFFLDYFATGHLENKIAEQVLKGIVEGCRQAKCALVGGETAEMPDFYSPGEYDLAGFAVGLVSPKDALPRKDIRPGDILIGLKSTGCHSNGYSLLRKLLSANGNDYHRALELLTPTQIYVSSVYPLVESRLVKGLAHITGSGFLNVPRMSSRVSYEIHLPSASERPPIYDWVKATSGLPFEELAQTFNLGIGMVLVTSPQNSSKVLQKLKKQGQKAWLLGEVTKLRSAKGVRASEVLLHDGASSVILKY